MNKISSKFLFSQKDRLIATSHAIWTNDSSTIVTNSKASSNCQKGNFDNPTKVSNT